MRSLAKHKVSKRKMARIEELKKDTQAEITAFLASTDKSIAIMCEANRYDVASCLLDELCTKPKLQVVYIHATARGAWANCVMMHKMFSARRSVQWPAIELSTSYSKLEWSNGSCCRALSTALRGIKGLACNRLVLDGVEYMPADVLEVARAIAGVSGSKVVLLGGEDFVRHVSLEKQVKDEVKVYARGGHS